MDNEYNEYIRLIKDCMQCARYVAAMPCATEDYKLGALDVLMHLEFGLNRVERGEPFKLTTVITD